MLWNKSQKYGQCCGCWPDNQDAFQASLCTPPTCLTACRMYGCCLSRVPWCLTRQAHQRPALLASILPTLPAEGGVGQEEEEGVVVGEGTKMGWVNSSARYLQRGLLRLCGISECLEMRASKCTLVDPLRALQRAELNLLYYLQISHYVYLAGL